jgi:pimeloyl-ACP methyl ester carboxylesterase
MLARLLLRLLGLLLILSAVGIALSRAPDRPVQTLVARWAPPPSDFIEVKGQLVHLRDEGPRGDPTPLLLLHGTGASLHTWDGWAAALKAKRRVIRIDLPGFGLTGPFGGAYAADDYRGDTYARFVLDVMDVLQVPRAAIGGNSLGGEVAWRAVSLAPRRFAQLILVDATGYAFTPDEIPLGFRVARIPLLNRVTEYLLPRAAVAASLRSVYGEPARIDNVLIDRYFELTLREGNRRALGLRLQQLEMGAQAERIKQLALPTLVLWGGRDRLVPPANGQRFAADIRGARLIMFATLGHVPQEEDPAATVAAALAFLETPP